MASDSEDELTFKRRQGEPVKLSRMRMELEMTRQRLRALEQLNAQLKAEPDELRRRVESAERKAQIAKHKLKVLRENFRFHYDYQIGVN
jgi:DnaJ-domain-containing protein 1